MTVNLTHRAALLEIYRELYDTPSQAITDQERVELKGQANRLQEESFTLAFIGRFSVGKSLLINRLFLGEDVLTVALRPTTARVLLIRYGDSPALWLVQPDADGVEQRVELVAPGGTVEDIRKSIKHHTTHLGKPSSKETGYFQLDWPNGQFFKEGVRLLDTIGTEDIDDSFIDQTYAAIRQSNAVIMTVLMNQSLTASEQSFLERHLGGTGKKIFLVVNKADSRSPEDQTIVIDDLRYRFGGLYRESEIRAEERIFAVSAKTGQGLDELRERLVRFVTQERLSEILIEHGEGLHGHLLAWYSGCQQTLTSYELKKAGDDERLRKTEKDLRKLADLLDHERDRLDGLRTDLADELEAQICDLKDKCRRELRSLDQQGGSIQVIGTDLAMAFSAGVTRLTHELQKHARQKLQYRIGKLASFDDLTLNTHDGEGKTVLEAIIANGGKAVGVSSSLAGLTATGMALQTAMATPIPWWGVGGTSLTTLFAGALAPWAIPAIIVGVGLFWGSNKYRETRRRQQREAFIASARTGLDRDCFTLKQQLGVQLNDYITATWQQFEERVEREREAMDALIAETDLSTLEARITATRDEERRLNGIAQRLDALLKSVV